MDPDLVLWCVITAFVVSVTVGSYFVSTFLGIVVTVAVFAFDGISGPPRRERATEDPNVPEPRMSRFLVGTRGKALTVLRPMGWVEVDGCRYEARTEIGLIDANATVVVAQIEGERLVVRPDTAA